MKDIGFVGTKMDSCLFMKNSTKGMVFIGLHVDDILSIRHSIANDDVMGQLRNCSLILKIENNLKDYLSCKINISSNMKQAWLGQSHLISNIEKHFGDRVSKLHVSEIPGTPDLGTIRETDQSKLISQEKQSLFCSEVGMLLYLIKHS